MAIDLITHIDSCIILAIHIVKGLYAVLGRTQQLTQYACTVEPPNKGHFGNGPLVLCSEVVPISEVHDFSINFDCIILNKLVNALKCMIKSSRDDNQVVGMFYF